MYAYVQYVRRAMQSQLVYRSEFLIELLWGVSSLFVQVSIWRALYLGKETVAGITLDQMITYVIVGGLTGVATRTFGSERVESKLKSGDIGLDLLKPVDFRLALAFENLGTMLAGFLVKSFPAATIGALAFGLQPPASFLHFFAFLLTMVNGFFIAMLIELIIGSLAFWFLSAWHFRWFFMGVKRLFSGQVIPLWFFPHWLLVVADVFPFKMTSFVPLSLYLGKTPARDILRIVVFQWAWIVGLGVFQEFLWRRGMRKIVIQGG